MAGNMDVIKEYLVSLGFSVKDGEFRKADNAVEALGKRVERMMGKFSVAGKAVAAYGAALGAATFGMAKFLNGLGNQEIQMEMLARQMWTTQQRAQAFSFTLSALHANIQQLYLSPTLMSQYRQLMSVAQRLQTPSDYNRQIHQIQNISLQFKQMRLEMSYARQWFGYNLIKDMAGPMGQVESKLKNLNQLIIKNIPNWTQKIASVASGFLQSFSVAGHAIDGAYHGLQALGNYLPTWVKVVGGAFIALDAIMSTNPFFLAIEGLSALLLLMDDYYVWSKGGKAEFGGLWKNLTTGVKDFQQALEKNGVIKDFGKLMSDLKRNLDGVQTRMNGFNVNNMVSGMDRVAKIIDDIVKGLDKVVQAIGWLEGSQTSTSINPSTTNRNLGWNMQDAGANHPYLSGSSTGSGWFSGLDSFGQNVGNKIAEVFQAMFMGHVAPMSGDARLQAYLQGGKSTNVTINQTNHFPNGDPNTTINAVNRSNSMLMRNFQTAVK